MRTALKIAVALIVLLVVGFIAASFVVNGMTRSAVEQRTADALGSPAHLNNASVGLLTGNFRLGTLTVENPGGFNAPLLLRVNASDGQIRYGTLFAEVVELPRLTIRDVEATLERRDGSANFDVALASMRKTEQTAAPAEEGRRYIIRELVLEDLVVHVDVAPAAEIRELTQLTVRIPELRLTDIGSEMDRGVVMEEVAGIVVKAILTAVLERAGEEIPGIVANELASRLSELEAIPAGIMEIGGERIGEALRDLDPSRLLRLPRRE